MFLRSLQKMLAVNPGFRTDHALVAQYQLPLQQYPTSASVATFNHAVVEQLSSKPGVSAVALSNAVAVSDSFPQSAYTVEGVSAEQWKLKFAAFTTVYGDYFDSMGIPLIDGRTFDMHDDANAPLVVIMNQTMARDCWPGQSSARQAHAYWKSAQPLPMGHCRRRRRRHENSSRSAQHRPVVHPDGSARHSLSFGNRNSRQSQRTLNGYITMRSALDPEHMIQTLRSTVARDRSALGPAKRPPARRRDLRSRSAAPLQHESDHCFRCRRVAARRSPASTRSWPSLCPSAIERSPSA